MNTRSKKLNLSDTINKMSTTKLPTLIESPNREFVRSEYKVDKVYNPIITTYIKYGVGILIVLLIITTLIENYFRKNVPDSSYRPSTILNTIANKIGELALYLGIQLAKLSNIYYFIRDILREYISEDLYALVNASVRITVAPFKFIKGYIEYYVCTLTSFHGLYLSVFSIEAIIGFIIYKWYNFSIQLFLTKDGRFTPFSGFAFLAFMIQFLIIIIYMNVNGLQKHIK